MTCRWTSPTTPRVIPGRHGELDGDPVHRHACKGCQPCTDSHCVICGHRHVRDPDDITCPSCIGSNRADLADIATLTDALPDQALTHASAAIPGGDALVLSGPSSAGTAQQWAETVGLDTSHKVDEHGTPIPTLLLLATWEDAWHDVLGTDDPPAPRATVDESVRWLSSQLHLIAQHGAFPEFVAEIRQARARLEVELLAGKRDVIGKVRCLDGDCGALLRQTYTDPNPCTHDTAARREVRRWVALGYPEAIPMPLLRAIRLPCGGTRCDQGGRRDRWHCPACDRDYTDEDYRLAKAQAALEAQPVRPAVQIARDFGIPASRLRQWITRGRLERRGTDSRGRVLLDTRDVRRLLAS